MKDSKPHALAFQGCCNTCPTCQLRIETITTREQAHCMTESNQLQTHCSLDRWEQPALPGLSSRDMVFVPLDQPIPIAGHLHIHSSFADRLFNTGEGVLPSDPDGKRLAIWIGCCTNTDIPLCAARLVQWALERGLPVIQMPAACATVL